MTKNVSRTAQNIRKANEQHSKAPYTQSWAHYYGFLSGYDADVIVSLPFCHHFQYDTYIRYECYDNFRFSRPILFFFSSVLSIGCMFFHTHTIHMFRTSRGLNEEIFYCCTEVVVVLCLIWTSFFEAEVDIKMKRAKECWIAIKWQEIEIVARMMKRENQWKLIERGIDTSNNNKKRGEN